MVPLEEKGFPYLEQPVQHPEDLSCRKVKALRVVVWAMFGYSRSSPLFQSGGPKR